MLSITGSEKVYLACGSTDLRKSIDGLAALVQIEFDLDPFAPGLFVFCNRKRDKLKILQWDHNGFWLYYRRLERGRFRLSQRQAPIEVSCDSCAGCWTIADSAKSTHSAVTAKRSFKTT